MKAPPEELRRLLVGLLRGARLEPLATLRTRRAGALVRDRELGFAEVVLDQVTLLDGDRRGAAFSEVEVELIDGSTDLLERLGDELRRAGAARSDGRPKVFRMLGLEQPPRPALADKTLDRLRTVMCAQVDGLLANDPGARLGDDPEALHQLRVATRRLRAILRAASGFVDPDWAEPLRVELRWLAAELGHVRDHDVMIAHLREAAAELDEPDAAAFEPLLGLLGGERDRDRERLLQAMSGQRYFELLDELEREPRLLPVSGSLPDVAGAEFRKLRKTMRALGGDPPDDRLHAARIVGKRARYAAELAGGRRTDRFVSELKKLQDTIGDHQDAIVTEDWLRRLAASGDEAAGLAAGRLVERQRARRREARAAVPEVWARVERAGRRAWA